MRHCRQGQGNWHRFEAKIDDDTAYLLQVGVTWNAPVTDDKSLFPSAPRSAALESWSEGFLAHPRWPDSLLKRVDKHCLTCKAPCSTPTRCAPNHTSSKSYCQKIRRQSQKRHCWTNRLSPFQHIRSHQRQSLTLRKTIRHIRGHTVYRSFAPRAKYCCIIPTRKSASTTKNTQKTAWCALLEDGPCPISINTGPARHRLFVTWFESQTALAVRLVR